MSHPAIAAVLARDELSAGERLAALSLASFANRDQLAWPGIPAATARAGLGRSRYLAAREQLVWRGLIEVENRGRGRGQASVVRLLFAQSGPWWAGDINVELVEAVLGYSRTRGPARLLLAALAALSDHAGLVEGLLTADLCQAAGLANSTYRRARAALLASGGLAVSDDSGGRGRTSRWRVLHHVELDCEPLAGRRQRRAPASGARPLVATVRANDNGQADRTETGTATAARVSVEKGPILSGVSTGDGPVVSGVSARKGPVLSGVSGPNPAKTPPETPPPDARAGREPVNPRTGNPPNPPEGGSSGTEVFIEETYRSDRGRLRRRRVAIDVDVTCAGFTRPTLTDTVDWERIRELLAARLGESTFKIWLSPLELRAVDGSHALVVDAPDATRSWVCTRFRRVIAGAGAEVGRPVFVADEAQSRAMCTLGFDRVGVTTHTSDSESSDASSCPLACASYSSSACSLSYTAAYNQAKEVG